MPTGIQLAPPPRRDRNTDEMMARSMMMQATDASPKGHWLAAVAQALQGYMGGRMLRRAQDAQQDEQTMAAKEQNAIAQALMGQYRDPNAPATHEVPIPGQFGTSPLQELPQADTRPQLPPVIQALMGAGPRGQQLAIPLMVQTLTGGQQGDPYTLGPEEVRFDSNNREVARGPDRREPQPRIPNSVLEYLYAVENDGYQGSLNDWRQEGRAPTNPPRTDAQRRRDQYEANVTRSAVSAFPGDPQAQLNEINSAMALYDQQVAGGAPAPAPTQQPQPQPSTVEQPAVEQPTQEQTNGMAPPADAYGLVSNIVNAFNTVFDWLGVGQPGESTALARRDADRLATDTVMTLERAVPGRPSNYLLQMFEGYVSRPGVFSGQEGALQSLEATRDAIQFMINDIGTINTRELTATQRGDLSETLTQLENLYNRYNATVNNFYTGIDRAGGGSVQRPDNVPPELWNVLTPAERARFAGGGN